MEGHLFFSFFSKIQTFKQQNLNIHDSILSFLKKTSLKIKEFPEDEKIKIIYIKNRKKK